MPQQLFFELPQRIGLGPGDYFVSEANASAYAMIRDDAVWPDGKLIVTGAAGSGKSHLARLWQDQTGATILTARAIDPGAPLPAAGARVVIEDMDQCPAPAEEYLFHLHNHLKSSGGRLLMTARTAPPDWPLTLPDLASRVQAASVVTIRDPDDALLHAVLTKHFADRQLNPSPRLINWILRRMERSFAAAGQIVAALDDAALARGSVINRSLAKSILDNDWPVAD
jgi:chromosomal replication initiation ATPase DnaA